MSDKVQDFFQELEVRHSGKKEKKTKGPSPKVKEKLKENERKIAKKEMCPKCFSETTEEDYINTRYKNRLTKLCSNCRNYAKEKVTRGRKAGKYTTKSYYVKKRYRDTEKKNMLLEIIDFIPEEVLEEAMRKYKETIKDDIRDSPSSSPPSSPPPTPPPSPQEQVERCDCILI